MAKCEKCVSVAPHIAEGYERQTDKEFIRYLYIAKASNAELRTQLRIATEVAVITTDIGHELCERSKRMSGMLQNLIMARRKSMIDQKSSS